MPINCLPGKPPKDSLKKSKYRKSVVLIINTGKRCVEYVRGSIHKGGVYILLVSKTRKIINDERNFGNKLLTLVKDSVSEENLPVSLVPDEKYVGFHESFHSGVYHWRVGKEKVEPICGIYDAPAPFRFKITLELPLCFCLRAGRSLRFSEIEEILKYLIRYIPLSILSADIKDIAHLLSEIGFYRFVRDDLKHVELLFHSYKKLKDEVFKSSLKNKDEIIKRLEEHGFSPVVDIIKMYQDLENKHMKLIKKLKFKDIFGDYTIWYIGNDSKFYYMVKANDMSYIEEILANYGLLKKFGKHKEFVKKLEAIPKE